MGLKQLNVQAPEDVHNVIKLIAQRTKSGESLTEVLHSISPKQNAPSAKVTHEDKGLIEIGRRVKALIGWRRSLVKLAGIL